MRSYWDDRARQNAAWYVDTSLVYDDPDMGRFFETGAEVVRTAVDEAPVSPLRRGRAVEIGSGLGRICLALADRFDAVDGVDISSEMIAQARALVDRPSVQFHLGDGASLSAIETGSADLVLSFTVFQHIPDESIIAEYIVEAGRVLRTGGVLAFQWNNEPGALRWRALRACRSLLQRSGLRVERRGRNAPQFLGSRVSMGHVVTMLTKAGLELKATAGQGTLFSWAWAVKP